MVVGGFLFSSTYISFDDIKFMAGKSMWRGGEFAPRRKSQSSDAQKKTSCQSRRSQVRSTQRRVLFRTIVFVQERNLGHPASWISSTSKSKVTMQVSQSVFSIGSKAPSGKKIIFFTSIALDNFNYLFLGHFLLLMICLRFKPQAFPASEVSRLGTSNSLFLLEADLTSTSSRRAAEAGEIFSSLFRLL